ncbi:MAG: hypothetical protein KatS3mg023_1348 [Armatimonadota bacterium]|nr:MAG: hypothetical protein KatS3mg023_1348 [Armatimonadota bacterium]
MNLVINYRLYPENFWVVEQSDWERATLSDFNTLHFYGDLIFRYSDAIFDYQNIPLLGFAYEFTEAFLKCLQGQEARVEYCFLESGDWLSLSLSREGKVTVQASYTDDIAKVPLDTLRMGLKRSNSYLIEELTYRFPFLKGHPIFRQIAAVLLIE